MENTSEIIKNFILTEFLPGEDPAGLADDTPLISGGILDSIATIKMTSFLEEKFGVGIEPHEMNKKHLDTISLITNLVQSKLQTTG